jgi:hypothetical protein
MPRQNLASQMRWCGPRTAFAKSAFPRILSLRDIPNLLNKPSRTSLGQLKLCISGSLLYGVHRSALSSKMQGIWQRVFNKQD